MSIPPLETLLLHVGGGEIGHNLNPVMKFRDEDFLVTEMLSVQLQGTSKSRYHYLLMRKQGVTTMEAVRLLASGLGVDSTEILYGGLKDEDGITQQVIAVSSRVSLDLPHEQEIPARGSGLRWIQLHHYGYGDRPIKIGGLQGNAFDVVLRNLSATDVNSLCFDAKSPHYFLNYYDTQRFGVPGGPKRTHLVGAALLASNWSLALKELQALRAPESCAALSWTKSPEEFFHSLDPRTFSFYLAAHASAAWNASLMELVASHLPGEVHNQAVSGIVYKFASSASAVLGVLSRVPRLPMERTKIQAGRFDTSRSLRETVVQTQLDIGRPEADEMFPGRFCARLQFFLPSGSYATTCLRQMIVQLRLGTFVAD